MWGCKLFLEGGMSGIVVQGGKAVKRVPHTGSPNSPVFSQLRVLYVSEVKSPPPCSLYSVVSSRFAFKIFGAKPEKNRRTYAR